MTNQIGIYDHTTGETIVREMTAEEIAQREAEIAEWQAQQELKAQQKAEAQAKREAAIAKLAALGLTEDDLKALGL